MRPVLLVNRRASMATPWEFAMVCPPSWEADWMAKSFGFSISQMALFRIVTVESAREDYGVKVPPC